MNILTYHSVNFFGFYTTCTCLSSNHTTITVLCYNNSNFKVRNPSFFVFFTTLLGFSMSDFSTFHRLTKEGFVTLNDALQLIKTKTT